MLYEIISPDALLRLYLEDYTTLSSIYKTVRNAYNKRVYVDKALQRKTNQLVQEHLGTTAIANVTDLVEINANTIQIIKDKSGGNTTKVINLIKSIEKTAQDNPDDPFLITMAHRAIVVGEKFEQRQNNTQETLDLLLNQIQQNEQRKREQAERGFDSLTYFVYKTLEESGINNPTLVSQNIKQAFVNYPNWQTSESELRELRKEVTFSICAEIDVLDRVSNIVEKLFTMLKQTYD